MSQRFGGIYSVLNNRESIELERIATEEEVYDPEGLNYKNPVYLSEFPVGDLIKMTEESLECLLERTSGKWGAEVSYKHETRIDIGILNSILRKLKRWQKRFNS